ncbi:hypothetical protein [Mucilaginibacter agri]|uniref:Uncharacterized protein n=1 Tax=Mucilaginibacter agri TaxID=2695265 RepID=A0A965ZEP0_9SPHI|nr:hypothetical protein [Mucilaginibacter agri]NCD69679.1 hypothetical protein [Mucilaginibacter agri]
MIFNQSTTIYDGERYEINGLNIWDYSWINTGKRIQVKDSVYGQNHIFPVYEIAANGATATFAAGEYSNCVWGVYHDK